MLMRDCNWMQVEEYLERDDRIVLPLGSTEQHGYLSLETDNLLAGGSPPRPPSRSACSCYRCCRTG